MASIKTIVPFEYLIHDIVNMHLQLLAQAEQRDEVIFHWRQVRYYHSLFAEHAKDIVVPDFDTTVKRILDDPKVFHISEVIKKHNLMEVE